MDEKSLREEIASITLQLIEVCERKGGAEYAHCKGCNQVKPLTDFHKDKKGVARCYCRECWNRNLRHYRQQKGYADRFKEYERKRYSDPEHQRRRQTRARLTQKVRSGKFPRATTRNCDRCGQPATHYHHPNGYNPDKWDDVIPVCKDCHALLHTRNK